MVELHLKHYRCVSLGYRRRIFQEAKKDVKAIGIFGTRVQGRTQLLAVNEVRDIEKVYAFDISANQSRKFAEEMSKATGVDIETANGPEIVVKKSEIIASMLSRRFIIGFLRENLVRKVS